MFHRFSPALIVFGLCVASSTALAQTGNAARGGTLYANNCSACHGATPDARAQNGANNPARIRAQIQSNPRMQFLSFLTDADLADIAAWIANPQAGVVPAANYTGMWYNPLESGWGISFVQSASTQVFVAWYDYRDDGVPRWMVVPGGTWTASNTFTGKLYRTQYNAQNSGCASPFSGTFNTSCLQTIEIGTVTITFANTTNASMAISIPGESINRTRPIQFLPF